MIRLGTIFWLVVVAATGCLMYKVKYGVQGLQGDLAHVRAQTVDQQREIHVLDAEWTYLTQPRRLSDLNADLLKLQPITTRQLLASVTEIPLRPPPVLLGNPIDGPVETVAASGEPPAAPSRLAAIPAAVVPVAVVPVAVVPVAVVKPARRPRSLDALFAEVAGER